jgi:hypothetical protein
MVRVQHQVPAELLAGHSDTLAMKTMEERADGTRILWDYGVHLVRDIAYPGAQLHPSPSGPLLISTDSAAVYCRKWQLSRGMRALDVDLTEIP